MLKVSKFGVEKIVEVIEEKRAKNREEFERIHEEATKLTEAGKFGKAQKLASKDVSGYYPVYAKAEKKEKRGDLKGAAKLYWENIFVNGTDAPANFRRLLIVLGKLGEPEDELKVARVYLRFVGEREKSWLDKRIERLEGSAGGVSEE